ncbi:integrase catalytic domain-containing protein [Trichonephila inaurata madagascariensis]|uniref:Integrase catalytic domain-containing protein n=1 Tax=Trichonephila inaurata madagascariensis TaxID=2747483 RepID=A0A8X6YC71_9ARAC|nr:integrase catalytic domain-containing protein [Trichonephila inaurata madagascariensis]
MLLGYSDTSEAAYGAVVYMHCVKDGTTTTKLIGSKSRVAPIKVNSIPRIELSASIAWINTPANQMKTFVGNRVSKIQILTENFEWKHIPSAQNPADIISRGVNPEELSSLTLWWNGPQLLDIPEQFIELSIAKKTQFIENVKARGQTSIELRKLIIKHAEDRKSVREISEIVKRSNSTVHDVIKRYKTNNQVENKPKKAPNKIFTEADERYLVRKVKVNPFLSAPKLAIIAENELGEKASPSTIGNVLHKKPH